MNQLLLLLLLLLVLMRFQHHKIATMGDIESMFYQVQIPEEQRLYVQFLWWEDGNVQNEIQQYEMCVHIFGGTSSPSRANYTL